MADTIKLSSRGVSAHDLGTVRGRGRAVAVEDYDMAEMLPPSNRTKREQRAASESWDDDFFTQGSASTSTRPYSPPRSSSRTSIIPQSASQLSLHQTPRQKMTLQPKLNSSRSNSSLNSCASGEWDHPSIPPRAILQPSRSDRPLRTPISTEPDDEGIENGPTSKKEKRTSWRKSLQRSLSGRVQREVVVSDVPPVPGQFVVLGRRSRGSSTAGTDREMEAVGGMRSNRSSMDWSDSGRDPFPRSTSLQFAPRPDVPYRKVSTSSASTASSRVDLERWREGTDTEGEFSEFSGDEFVERELSSVLHHAGKEGGVEKLTRRRSKRLKKRKEAPSSAANSIGIYANSRRPSIPLQMGSDGHIDFPTIDSIDPDASRRSTSSGKPPVARRTTSGAFYNLISRSTSAIQSISKRSPSPVPTLSNPLSKSQPAQHDIRSFSSADVRLPPVPALPNSTSTTTITRKHRPSSSVDIGQLSFFARARSISRPTKVVPPPTPPQSLVDLPTYENRQSIDLSDREEEFQAGEKYSTIRQQNKRLATIPGSSSTVRHDRRSPSASPTAFRSPPPLPPMPRISHRPNLSLASGIPRSAVSALPLGGRGGSIGGAEESLDDNGMGSLRIPRRLISTQAKIEEDMERVKEFARGIDDLKQLQFQYLHLISLSTSPPPTPITVQGFDSSPSVDALEKMSQAVKRIEIEYSRWWEQASFLISLGEGDSTRKDSPGVAASKRDRCVSLAAPRSSEVKEGGDLSKQMRELELGEEDDRPVLRRGASVSSVDSRTSVSNRQRDMLRGVLSAKKGSSLPTRGLPVVRPPIIPLISPVPTVNMSRWSYKSIPFAGSSIPHSATLPVLPTFARSDIRLQANGAKDGGAKGSGKNGIKDFISRLRVKAFEEAKATLHQAQNRSVSDPTHSNSTTTTNTPRRSIRAEKDSGFNSPRSERRLTASHSSSEEEDWDLFSVASPVVSGSSPATSAEAVDSREPGGMEKIELTTEGMPSLLLKVDEVRDRLRECITRLKGVTV